jgi:hypothetical protein
MGNLFALKLEEILAAHGQKLSQLNPRLGISADKARRLQQSLQEAKSLPVLGPEELERLELELPLSSKEWVQLRAALLATAIERMLMDRIGHDKALQAAEQIVLLIDEALQEQLQEISGPGINRIPDGEASEDIEADLTWEAVYHALDSATMALQLSYYVSSYGERVKRLREAQGNFQDALNELNNLDEGIKSLSLWQDYIAETHQGLHSIAERLEDLGEE